MNYKNILILIAVILIPTLALAERTGVGGDLPDQSGNNGKYLTTDGSVLSWATVSGSGDVVGPASSTDNAITRFDSTTGKLIQNSNWTIDNNGLLSASISTEQGFSLITSLGAGAGNNLMYLETTNSAWDRPLLRIIDNTTSGGAANIRIDSPNPDIEFVETDQSSPAGKFEIAVQSDTFQINGRNAADNSFEPITAFWRTADGGMQGLGTDYDIPNAMLEIVTNTGLGHLYLSSAVGANSGNIFKINEDGSLVYNDRGSDVDARFEGDTDANLLYLDAGNDRLGVGIDTPLQKLHVKGRAQFGVASNTSGTIDLANSGAAGLTRIAPGSPGSDVTVTLPSATGTLATLAGVEALTNKTISGASNTITNIDLSASVNLTAGRSLTLTGDDVLADAELYTDTKCIYFESPTASDDFKSIWFAKQAATLTSIWAESDQTVTFMLQVDDGTPADVDSVDLAPAAGTAEDTALNGDATMASGDRLDIDLVSVSGTPTRVSICWTFQYDD